LYDKNIKYPNSATPDKNPQNQAPNGMMGYPERIQTITRIGRKNNIPKLTAFVETMSGSFVDCNMTFHVTCKIAEIKTIAIAATIIYFYTGTHNPHMHLYIKFLSVTYHILQNQIVVLLLKIMSHLEIG